MNLENVDAVYPLSPLQEGMLIHSVSHPTSSGYIVLVSARVHGDVDPLLFRESFDDVVHHYAALRTVFLWDGLQQPLQVERRDVEIPWTDHDWCNLSPQEKDSEWEKLCDHERHLPFSMSAAPLMRMHFVKESENCYRFAWALHHILADAWSSSVVLEELAKCYRSKCAKKGHRFHQSISYEEHVAWLNDQNQKSEEVFWKAELAGVTGGTFLLDGVNPDEVLEAIDTVEEQLCRSEESTTVFSDLQSTQLSDWARQQNLTLATLVHAAWALLVSRYTGNLNPVFGGSFSGRSSGQKGIEKAVGLFTNTLPLQIPIDGGAILSSWMRDVQSRLLDFQSHEHCSLASIQKWCDIPNGTSLFDSLVVVAHDRSVMLKDGSSTQIRFEDVQSEMQSEIPVTLVCTPPNQNNGGNLKMSLLYHRRKVTRDSAERILRQLATILQSFLHNESTVLSQLPLLTAEDHAAFELLSDSMHAFDSLDDGIETVLDLIGEQVRCDPDRVAILTDRGECTFRELELKSNQLADALVQKGVELGDRIGLCCDRSEDMIVAIIGVLKAGAAYVPIDPDYPDLHRRQVIENAKIRFLLTDVGKRQESDSKSGPQQILIESLIESSKETTNAFQSRAKKDGIAYLIYTSGSSGIPKGVMVTHENLAFSTQSRVSYYENSNPRFLLLSSVAFDSSVAGIFGTLAEGGTLVLPPSHIHRDAHELALAITRHEVTHTLLLPSLYRVLLEEAPTRNLLSLRTVIVAGEACPVSLKHQHFASIPNARLFNEYGPTEATVWSSVHQICQDDLDRHIPIGKAIPGTELSIRDSLKNKVGIGVPGELYISGRGVAAGYFDDDALTDEHFVKTHLAENGTRHYRTGDRVILSPDGNLFFLGRCDRQVKVRGHRVELESVESTLRSHPLVRDVVVCVESESNASSSNLDRGDRKTLLDRLMNLEPEMVHHLLQSVEANRTPTRYREGR